MQEAADITRQPVTRDYLVYYLCPPAVIACLLATLGTRLTVNLPFLDSLGYLLASVTTAWWAIDLGSRGIRRLFASWRPPATVNIVLGYCVMIVPLTFYFQWLGDVFANVYPEFAVARQESYPPSWSVDYLLHFARYSVPMLALFLIGALGYRYMTGMDWYGYPPDRATDEEQESGHIETEPDRSPAPVAGLFGDTKLPADAELLALKADEHYVRVWSEQGTDMLRYRFQDAVHDLEDFAGMQVHRSWWVNLARVDVCRRKGRSLELCIGDDLSVPVSLAYKQAVSNALDSRAANGGSQPPDKNSRPGGPGREPSNAMPRINQEFSQPQTGGGDGGPAGGR